MSRPPLSGLRVLDVSHNLAGPLTAMHLGDLGADVIKVERPAGDEWRDHERVPGRPGRSRHYVQANRNKRAVCLDLGRPEAQDVMRDLVARADVLVTNMRPGVAERLGFGWEVARKLNPGLVYCAISAFGADGPRGGRPGYDILAEALAGFMPPSLAADGEAPRSSPIPINDTALPLLACTGIMAALIERGRSGRGQLVEASVLGTAVALNAHSLVRIESLPGPRGADLLARLLPRLPHRRRLARGGRLRRAAGAPLLRRPRPARACSTSRPGTTARRASSARTSSSRCSRRASSSHTTAWWDDAMAEAGVPAAPGARARRPLRRPPRPRHRPGRGGRRRRAGAR